jgi:hypothetical protein
MTIKGEGISSFINQQSQSNESALYLALNDVTVYIEGLKLDCMNWNIIRSGNNIIDVYLKNITKGSVTSECLVTIMGSASYWVSGSGYVQAVDGVDGWTYENMYGQWRWRFMGENDTTYWTE